MLIKETLNNVDLNIDLYKKVVVLKDNSGTGKTFLSKLLSEYCSLHGLKYGRIDYDSCDLSDDLTTKELDILFLDNADLYLDNDKLLRAKSLCRVIIVCIKDFYGFSKGRDTGYFTIEYDGREMNLRGY